MNTNPHAPEVIIYALINPINCKVFYVGSTVVGLNKRLNGHIRNAKNNSGSNGYKNKLIQKIISKGKLPLIEELEVCRNYSTPHIAECFWVYLYRALGHRLTNGQPHSYYCKLIKQKSKCQRKC